MKAITLNLIPSVGSERSITRTYENGTTDTVAIAVEIDYDFTVNKLITTYSGVRTYDLFTETATTVEKIDLVSPNLTDVLIAARPAVGLDMLEELTFNTTARDYLLALIP